MATYIGTSPARLAVVSDNTIKSTSIIDGSITGSDIASNLVLSGVLTVGGQTAITGKNAGTDFTSSLLVGHNTTGTLSSDAIRNVGVGIAALDAITTGDENTAVGYQAGSNLSSGAYNTVLGSQALPAASTAAFATAIGRGALFRATGNYNKVTPIMSTRVKLHTHLEKQICRGAI